MSAPESRLTAGDLRSGVRPTWCPGCGDYAVLAALQKALAALDLPPERVLVVSGIGCSSNLPHFLRTYGIHGIHGRAIPIATGARLVNPDLVVVAVGGDGDGYAIGIGHFIHAMRRNIDITYIVMDNQIYGLTTGQASPTSLMGHRTKSTPHGVIERPVDPISLALSSGATFVSRGFSGSAAHLTDLIAGALQHRGFSLVDVLSPCVTFNRANTYQWFRERIYDLRAEGHDTSDIAQAFERSLELPERFPIGIFYRSERPTYGDMDAVVRSNPPVKQRLGWTNGMKERVLAPLR